MGKPPSTRAERTAGTNTTPLDSTAWTAAAAAAIQPDTQLYTAFPYSVASLYHYLPSYVDLSSAPAPSSAYQAPAASTLTFRPSGRMSGTLPPSGELSAPVNRKPIRFINTTDGQPHTKRRRIHHACITCRRRKTRCSGERPICETCSQNGHKCLGYSQSSTSQKPKIDASAAPEGDEDEDVEGGETTSQGEVEDEDSLPSPAQSRTKTPLLQEPIRRLSRDSSGSSSPRAVRKGKQKDFDQSRSEDSSPSISIHPASASSESVHRVPYFRYFGPTAIVPGFKQMVGQVRDSSSQGSARSISASPLSNATGSYSTPRLSPYSQSGGPTQPYQRHAQSSSEMRFYAPNEATPNSPLVVHLVQLFFAELGCSFPFLQQERFQRDFNEKKVEAVLVDAVCALAARFSDHPQLSTSTSPTSQGSNISKSAPFAERAMPATWAMADCPSVAVAQASLLLAYEEFGSNRGSSAWSILGNAIRVAQDLGMQKSDGLKYEGLQGPKPTLITSSRSASQINKPQTHIQEAAPKSSESSEVSDQRAAERERIDTFWAIYFLDRVMSASLGRPVTIRDEDIEIAFPSEDNRGATGWPSPFPALIRVIHLSGQTTDVFNHIDSAEGIDVETLTRLKALEKELSSIYAQMPPQLHFNIVSFQQSIKWGQAPNFLLFHLWFHSLIVLLHKLSLSRSFAGQVQSIYPNSDELSLSSATTIANILSFAEANNTKSLIGNPFISQPIYFAACAFLREISSNVTSKPNASDETTKSNRLSKDATSGGISQQNKEEMSIEAMKTESLQQAVRKRATLLSPAEQNYQRCYNALKRLERHWAGVRYIIIALDQKAMGDQDPQLYTIDDLQGVAVLPSSEASFKTPGWRVRTSSNASITEPIVPTIEARARSRNMSPPPNTVAGPSSPSQAVGWSLTGDMSSSSSNFTPFIFQQPISHNSRRLSSTSLSSTTDAEPGSRLAGGAQSSSQYLSPPGHRDFQATPSYGIPSADAGIGFDYDPSRQQQVYSTQGLQYSAQSMIPTIHPGGGSGMTAEALDSFSSVASDGMVPWLDGFLPQDILDFYDPSVVENLAQQNVSDAGPSEQSASGPPH